MPLRAARASGLQKCLPASSTRGPAVPAAVWLRPVPGRLKGGQARRRRAALARGAMDADRLLALAAAAAPAMGADGLLALAGQAEGAGDAAEEKGKRIRMARRLGAAARWRKAASQSNGAPRQGGVAQRLRVEARRTQEAWLNREAADHVDYQVRESTHVRGRGKYKQRAPEGVLRVAFEPPELTVRQLAKKHRAPPLSHRHARDIVFMASERLRTGQREKIAKTLSSTLLRFAIVHVVFDGASFALLREDGDARAVNTEVLAVHGRLVWGLDREDGGRGFERGDVARRVGRDAPTHPPARGAPRRKALPSKFRGGLDVGEEDVFTEPVAIAGTSARSIYAGLQAALPPEMAAAFAGLGFRRRLGPGFGGPLQPVLTALVVGCDQHPSNCMILAHSAAIAERNLFVLPGFCQQHATGNALRPMLQRLGVLNPTYCLAKRLRQDAFRKRFLAGMRAHISEKLHVVRRSEEPDWRPLPQDQARSRRTLELAYFNRDLRRSLPGAGEDEQKMTRRKDLGERLLRECPGDWRQEAIIFWDAPGPEKSEFATREGAVEHVFWLLKDVAFHVLPDPALNKWLSMWPLLSDVVAMMCFHKVFLAALDAACNVTSTEQGQLGELSEFSEGERVGVLSEAAWVKRERRRDLKLMRWLPQASSQFKGMVFLLVASRIMRLHFSFFKHAQEAPYGETESLIFKLCDPAESNIHIAETHLQSHLEAGGDENYWQPVEDAFGEFSSWPPTWRELARGIVLSALGEVKRRLSDTFGQPPFKFLVPLVSPRSSPAVRRRHAEAFMMEPEAQLDRCSRRIRAQLLAGPHENPVDALLSPVWQKFLFHAVNTVPVSSAIVECLFAAFNVWLKPMGRHPGLAMLQAKHMTAAFARGQKRKQARRDGTPQQKRRTAGLCRPAWVIKRGESGRATAYSEFVGDFMAGRRFPRDPDGAVQRPAPFRSAGQAWRQADALQKSRAAARAKASNARVLATKGHAMAEMARAPTDRESVWDLGGGGPFPLSTESIREVLTQARGVISDATSWAGRAREVEEAADFPATVEYIRPALKGEEGLNKRQMEAVRAFLDDWRLLHRTAKGPHRYRPLLMTDVNTGSCGILLGTSLVASPTFRAEGVRLRAEGRAGVWGAEPITFPCKAVVSQVKVFPTLFTPLSRKVG